MPFGKYQGKDFSEVPTNYLQWLLTQDWLFDDLRHKVQTYLTVKKTEAVAKTEKFKTKAKKRKKKHTPEEVRFAIREYEQENRWCAHHILANRERSQGLRVMWAELFLTNHPEKKRLP
jgi:uncharacterized protein (DUF3820 family)